MTPMQRDLKIHCGADFVLAFRLKEDCSYIDLTGYAVYFKAVDSEDNVIIDIATGDSPTYIDIDVDDDSLVTIDIPAAITSAYDPGALNYQLDVVDTDGNRNRWLNGNIQVLEGL